MMTELTKEFFKPLITVFWIGLFFAVGGAIAWHFIDKKVDEATSAVSTSVDRVMDTPKRITSDAWKGIQKSGTALNDDINNKLSEMGLEEDLFLGVSAACDVVDYVFGLEPDPVSERRRNAIRARRAME